MERGQDEERKNVPIYQAKGEIAPVMGKMPPSKDAVSDLICRELIREAEKMLKFSYSPYSRFAVGAALLTRSKKIYTGCNMENAAYSPSICAERTAFCKAISEGEREFTAIAIIGGKNKFPVSHISPCGVCRQVMAEFCGPQDFYIILARSEEDYWLYSLEELFPMSFSPQDLEKEE